MFRDSLSFFIIFLFVLLGFMQATIVLKPSKVASDATWSSVTETLSELYGSIFGDFDLQGEFDDTVHEITKQSGRALSALYLFVASLILLNLLIAIYNNTYSQITSESCKFFDELIPSAVSSHVSLNNYRWGLYHGEVETPMGCRPTAKCLASSPQSSELPREDSSLDICSRCVRY